MPTEAEIKDKGKNDWLAKSLVLQTLWFAMQCIARAIEHLPVTHLEIVTPLNANQPVRVFRESEPRETQSWVSESISGARKLTWEALGNGFVKTLGFIIGLQDYGVDLSREDRVLRF